MSCDSERWCRSEEEMENPSCSICCLHFSHLLKDLVSLFICMKSKGKIHFPKTIWTIDSSHWQNGISGSTCLFILNTVTYRKRIPGTHHSFCQTAHLPVALWLAESPTLCHLTAVKKYLSGCLFVYYVGLILALGWLIDSLHTAAVLTLHQHLGWRRRQWNNVNNVYFNVLIKSSHSSSPSFLKTLQAHITSLFCLYCICVGSHTPAAY